MEDSMTTVSLKRREGAKKELCRVVRGTIRDEKVSVRCQKLLRPFLTHVRVDLRKKQEGGQMSFGTNSRRRTFRNDEKEKALKRPSSPPPLPFSYELSGIQGELIRTFSVSRLRPY